MPKGNKKANICKTASVKTDQDNIETKEFKTIKSLIKYFFPIFYRDIMKDNKNI